MAKGKRSTKVAAKSAKGKFAKSNEQNNAANLVAVKSNGKVNKGLTEAKEAKEGRKRKANKISVAVEGDNTEKNELVQTFESGKKSKQIECAPADPKKAATPQSRSNKNINNHKVVSAHFVDDDNYIDMDITDDFPSDEENMSQEDEDNEDEDSETEVEAAVQKGHNNNATLVQDSEGEEGEIKDLSDGKQWPSFKQAFNMMQDFMLHKGILTDSMSEEDMLEFLEGADNWHEHEEQLQTTPKKSKAKSGNKGANSESKRGKTMNNSESETTIYQRAVKEKGNSSIRDHAKSNKVDNWHRKTSSSSDEFIDTSDELILDPEDEINLSRHFIADCNVSKKGSPEPGTSKDTEPELTAEEKADLIIKEAEKSRACMLDLPGRSLMHSFFMDEDYHMIDAHIDENLKKKIINLEYVDFSRLLAKDRSDERQCLEIVNKDEVAFLSPIAERESGQNGINSYIKWEQAFQIYSNVLTCKFPGKSSELLQYNHIIHSTSMSYTWDNVYAYDKEFRHIARHPRRPWNVILQQAWNMIIKDRVRGNNIFQKQVSPAKIPEPCRRYNKGKCT